MFCRFVRRSVALLATMCGLLPLAAGEADTSSVAPLPRVSLLTCSPGGELYSLFGHTALRVVLPAEGADVTFNYGVFSFSQPYFMWRFVRGETDYRLGATDYEYFKEEYMERGSAIVEQPLALAPHEAEALVRFLLWNVQPRNSLYRYNYFYDNCTTRARDAVERAVGGRLRLDTASYVVPGWSYRRYLHRLTRDFPWSTFGYDLLLGCGADVPLDGRQATFLPHLLCAAFATATVELPDGSRRALVGEERQIGPLCELQEPPALPIGPQLFFWLLLAATLLVCLAELRWHRNLWLCDVLLYGAQGAAGCVIAFLVFFSQHPTVGGNLLIVVFNPITLLYLPRMIYLQIKRRRDLYHPVAATLILAFVALSPLLPQHFNAALYPALLALALRSLYHCFTIKRNTRHK